MIIQKKCLSCKDCWSIIKEDHKEKEYLCPFCVMPISQLIEEIYNEEGIEEIIRIIKIRENYARNLQNI